MNYKRDDGSYSIGLWPSEKASKWKHARPVEIDGKTYWIDIYENRNFQPGGKYPEFNLVLKPAEPRQNNGSGHAPNPPGNGFNLPE